jgi:predicted Rossmann-fold nucleotide-binding protein
LINTNDYYDGFLVFLDHAMSQGFIKPETRKLIEIAKDAESALDIAQSHWTVQGTKPMGDEKLDELIGR